MEPKEIVRRGYDALSYRYRGDAEEPARYATWVAQLRERVPAGGAILDLGCGCGVPLTRDLAAGGYKVTGVDLSAVQVERARELVPTARFLHVDATQVRFPAASFDAVVSLYALIHIPLDEQPALLGRIGRWLRPGGWLLATTGQRAWTGSENGWLGGDTPMWWSHADAETYRRWIGQAGLAVVSEEVVPEGDAAHALFWARRPADAGDQELLARQAALQAEATQVLAELDLGRRFADVGPVLVVGSYLSGLMCWRDLDVGLLTGEACSPSDVLELLKRVVELPGFAGFTYRDERGERCSTGEARDERYHVPFDLDAGHGRWRIDLSIWLRDLHGHVADWHLRLRDTITDQQRLAVLRIKDVWHRLPSYPDEVGGWEIYTAVLQDGVRTPGQFAPWLASNGFPSPAADLDG